MTEKALINAALGILRDRQKATIDEKEGPTNEEVIVALLALLGESHRFIKRHAKSNSWPLGMRGYLALGGGDK